ncbi:EamA family transporter [Pseudooceanicola sp. 200-1SW]|uniref:EamA family transporter n=1 Tax=Pseudooceanicola sp. 200-1SW TaxID=3425949 RepID=UPI003D7FDB11
MKLSANNAIFLNVLLWSLFPLLTMLIGPSRDIWTVAFLSQVVGLLVVWPFAGASAIWTVTRRALRQEPRFFFLMAAASVFLQYFFARSAVIVSGAVSIVILELWPVLAYVFAGRFIRKDWERPGIGNLAVMVLSVFGLLVTIFPELVEARRAQGGQWEVDLSLPGAVGVGFAILAAVASAATILQAELANRVAPVRGMGDAAAMVGALRVAGVVICGLMAVANGPEFADPQVWALGLGFGVTGFGLASLLAVYGVNFTRSTSSILLWFLAPPLGLFWVAVIYGGRIEETTLVGFAIIFLANSFLNTAELRRPSFIISLCALLLSGGAVLYLPALPEPGYFDVITVLVAFFSIFTAFIVSRKTEVFAQEAHLLAEACEGCDAAARLRLIEGLERGEPSADRAEPLLERLILLRAASPYYSETIVSTILALSVICIALVFRPGTLLGDAFAVVLVFAVTYSLMHLYEMTSRRRAWRRLAELLRQDVVALARRQRQLVLFCFVVAALLLAIGVLLTNRHLHSLLA